MTTIAHSNSLDHTVASTHSPRGAGTASPAAVLSRSAKLDAALALLRFIVGAVFLAHGAQKLFVFGFAGVIGAFEGMGVPLPGVVGPGVALLEFFGGLALIAGLFTRLAGLGLAINMLGAVLLVHLSAGLFLPNGVEFALTLFGAAAALALTGAGSFSADAVLAKRRAQS